MLRFLASGFLTRRLARYIYRLSPNPIVRTVGVAAAGMLASRLLTKRTPRRR